MKIKMGILFSSLILIVLLSSCKSFDNRNLFNSYDRSANQNKIDYLSQKLQDTSQDFILISIKNYTILANVSPSFEKKEIQYLFLPKQFYDSLSKKNYNSFKIIRYTKFNKPKVICETLGVFKSLDINTKLFQIANHETPKELKYEFTHETEIYIKYHNFRKFEYLTDFDFKTTQEYLPLLDCLKSAIFEHEFLEKLFLLDKFSEER